MLLALHNISRNPGRGWTMIIWWRRRVRRVNTRCVKRTIAGPSHYLDPSQNTSITTVMEESRSIHGSGSENENCV